MAVCVCVIGKDNGPIYMRSRSRGDESTQMSELTVTPEQGLRGILANSELQYNFIVSSALDIIEERVLAGSSAAGGYKGNPGASGGPSPQGTVDGQPLGTRELYLGALTAREEYKVYGYMTNTKIKFVIVIEETNIPLRENDIRTMFRKLHGAFCDLMSNPFYLPGSEIKSKRFDAVVTSIMSGQ